MVDETDKVKKGRKIGKVDVYELTIANAGVNGHGVVLKSESKDMKDKNFLELEEVAESAEGNDESLASALDEATPDSKNLHGEPEAEKGEGGEALVPVEADATAGEVAPAPEAEVAEEPEAGVETIVTPEETSTDEISEEQIGAEILSFAVALERASKDTSDAVAIAKAVGSLEFLAGDTVIARLKAGDLNKVIRKSAAAALGEAIQQLQGVKGSKEIALLEEDAVRLFKSVRVAVAQKEEPISMADRIKLVRKSLGVLDTVGRVQKPAAIAASPRLVPESSSRTEPKPNPLESSWEDCDVDDINA
jgi:hypothetical protein